MCLLARSLPAPICSGTLPSMASSIPRDLGRLQADCELRLAGCPAHRFAARMILWALTEIWDDEQGIPEEDAAVIDEVLGPRFDRVAASGSAQEAASAVDDLVTAWESLQRLSQVAPFVLPGTRPSVRKN